MLQRDMAYCWDILEACYLIHEFIADLEDDAFFFDKKTQSAVIYKMMIIGEATTRLSQATKDAYPHIPWHKMIGMRNVLPHDDMRQLESIWQTANKDIPQLIGHLKALWKRSRLTT